MKAFTKNTVDSQGAGNSLSNEYPVNLDLDKSGRDFMDLIKNGYDDEGAGSDAGRDVDCFEQWLQSQPVSMDGDTLSVLNFIRDEADNHGLSDYKKLLNLMRKMHSRGHTTIELPTKDEFERALMGAMFSPQQAADYFISWAANMDFNFSGQNDNKTKLLTFICETNEHNISNYSQFLDFVQVINNSGYQILLPTETEFNKALFDKQVFVAQNEAEKFDYWVRIGANTADMDRIDIKNSLLEYVSNNSPRISSYSQLLDLTEAVRNLGYTINDPDEIEFDIAVSAFSNYGNLVTDEGFNGNQNETMYTQNGGYNLTNL